MIPQANAADLPDDLGSAGAMVVVDVRQHDEWDAGHVAGSLHIPLMDLPQRLGELPAEPFLVVCRVGGRSASAVHWLQAQGYDATNLADGLFAWTDAGRPLVGSDGRPGYVS